MYPPGPVTKIFMPAPPPRAGGMRRPVRACRARPLSRAAPRSRPASRAATSASPCGASRTSTISSSSALCTEGAAKRRWWQHLDDVAAGRRDPGGDVGQHAGPVRDVEVQPQDAPVPQQVAQQHVGQDARVDVAAADRGAHRLAGEALREGQDGREAGRAGALGHHAWRLRPAARWPAPPRAPAPPAPRCRSRRIMRERHLADIAHRDAFGDGRPADRDGLRRRGAAPWPDSPRPPRRRPACPAAARAPPRRSRPAARRRPPESSARRGSGASSSISSARVPWPAMTPGSS